MTCPLCQFPYQPAPSKRLNPCPNRLHKERTGEYLTESRRRKAKEPLERSRQKSAEKKKQKPPKTYKIPKQSTKGAKQAREVTKTKRAVTEAAMDGDHVECQGCGHFFDTIDRSHKTPLSKNKEHAANQGNITLLCRGCHTTWEVFTLPDVLELKCFFVDMKSLFDLDNERF